MFKISPDKSIIVDISAVCSITGDCPAILAESNLPIFVIPNIDMIEWETTEFDISKFHKLFRIYPESREYQNYKEGK